MKCELTFTIHCIKYVRIRVLNERVFSFKDNLRFCPYTGQWKSLFLHILCSDHYWQTGLIYFIFLGVLIKTFHSLIPNVLYVQIHTKGLRFLIHSVWLYVIFTRRAFVNLYKNLWLIFFNLTMLIQNKTK